MPKYSELSIEIAVNKVSCPGVWLCQQGKVSLTLFALGTSYQTTLAPPVFPIVFKEIFHFKKTFSQSCAFHNVPSLLKAESLYCELVQWSSGCGVACAVLAQYLGSLGDALFPPSVCWCDGVDLLMRRTEHFPGILAPKIEISTTVRLDEMWRRGARDEGPPPPPPRQLRVCHSPMYHRRHHDPLKKYRSKSSDPSMVCGACVTPGETETWRAAAGGGAARGGVEGATAGDYGSDHAQSDDSSSPNADAPNTILLESKFIAPEVERGARHVRPVRRPPCVCGICRRYEQLFHTDKHA